MDKATVIKVRDIYGKENLKVVCDNVYYFNSRVDNIIWNDTDEVFYAVRSNEDFHSNDTRPIKIEAVSYDQIQYINCTNAREKAKEIMLAIGYPANKVDGIINKEAPTGIQHGMEYDNVNTYQP